MTKFESNGVNMQIESSSKFEAQKRFENSCDLCCKFGLHIECDRCAIATVHNQVLEFLTNSEVKVPALAVASR